MAYGIYIENPNGFIKIDESYARFRILQSGTLTTPGPVMVPTQSQQPLVFIRPSAYGVPFRVGSLYVDRFWVYSGNYNGAPEVNLDYRVVNRSDLIAVPTGVFGINVMGPTGALLFTSEDRFINIDTVINFTISSSIQDFTVPAPEFGTRFIAMVGPNVIRMVPSGTYMTSYCQYMTLLNETTIRVGEVAFAPVNMYFALPGLSIIGQPCTLISGYL